MSQSQTVVARIINGRKTIRSQLLWSDVNCEIHAGEFIAIIGENGVGKSTLLHCIMRMQHLSSGHVYCTKSRAVLTQLMPDVPLIPITAQELLSYSLQGSRTFLRRKYISQQVDEAIELAGIELFANKPINTLSGGQWQRVRIAASTVSGPELLSLDEPLRGLDPAYQHCVMDNLHKWQRTSGASVIMVSHVHAHLLPRADRIFNLDNHGLTVITHQEALTLL